MFSHFSRGLHSNQNVSFGRYLARFRYRYDDGGNVYRLIFGKVPKLTLKAQIRCIFDVYQFLISNDETYTIEKDFFH